MVKDNLAVRGNITVPSSKTIDGVDVSALAETVSTLTGTTGLPSGCSSGQVTKFDGSNWACGDDIDTDTDTDTDTNTTYTAGSGIAISNGVISSTVVDTDTNTTYTASTGLALNGTVFSVSSITSSLLAANAVDSSTAIQSGDIETGDLPSLSSDTLTDVSSLAMLDEAETITGDWVNTTNPWADNEVTNALTISGGTVNGTPIGSSSADTGNFSMISRNGVVQPITVPRYVSAKAASVALPSGNTVQTAASEVIIGRDNLPLVVYYNGSGLAAIHCSDDDCASASEVYPAPSANVGAVDVVIGADGYPQIAWLDSVGADLEFTDCADVLCGSVTTTTIDSTGSVGWSADIVIGSDGFPQIVYFDDTNNYLKIADCSNATCSSSTITTLDTSGTVGRNLAAAAAPDGRTIIAYENDAATNQLIYSRCDNTTCTADTTATLDASAVIQNAIAIAMGDDLLPIILYIDDTNLITIHCGNSGCSSGNTATTQSASATSDDNLAMTIGADGMPLLAYALAAGVNNADYYVTYCTNAACSAAENIDTLQSEVQSTATGAVQLLVRENGLPLMLVAGGVQELVFAKNKFFVDYWTQE